ncbi:hypothetical protein [Marinicrinis lubricantis]|uniref:Uncharacterized protein n=1 Tax=Marinicrinis lubricantis TaxID=2086470 RepID=A0ABW1IM45_9BACL
MGYQRHRYFTTIAVLIENMLLDESEGTMSSKKMLVFSRVGQPAGDIIGFVFEWAA